MTKGLRGRAVVRIGLGLLLGIAVLPATRPVDAADRTWTNTAGGSWETAANWNPASTPTNTDTILITSTGTYTVNVNNATADTDPGGANSWMTVNNLTVGNVSGLPALLVDFTNTARTLVVGSASAGTTIIGDAASQNGSLLLNNGTLQTYELRVANAAGSAGTIVLNGGQLIQTNGTTYLGLGGNGTIIISNGIFRSHNEFLGWTGSGTLNIYGGTNLSDSGALELGTVSSASTGSILVDGGALIVTNSGGVYIGATGNGTLTTRSGLVQISAGYPGVLLGDSAGVQGTWNIFGGSNLAGAATYLTVGSVAGSTGQVMMTGGYFEPAPVTFVGGSGMGTIVQSNGTINSRYWIIGTYGGSSGALNQYGGTNVAGNGYVYIGSSAGSTGSVLVAGGLLRFTNAASSFYVGYNGVGSITVSNGQLVADKLEVGAAAAGQGALNARGGLTELIGSLQIGNAASATGSVEIASAGVLQLDSSVTIGNASAGAGSITNRDGGTVRFNRQSNPTITMNAGGTFVSTNAIIEFKDTAAASVTGNITNITLLGRNTLSLNHSTNASAGSYTIDNASGLYSDLRLINAGSRWQGTSLTIGSGGSLLATNTIGSVQGTVSDGGTITVANSRMTFEGALTISGRYVSDPSTNIFLSNVVVAASGSLAGGAGDRFEFQKSLFISNTVNTTGAFDLSRSTVAFTSGGLHTNAITGKDLGSTSGVGYADGFTAANFSYGRLTLGTTNDPLLVTSGDSSASSNALYIGWLDLAGFTNEFASVSNMVASLLFAPTNINLYYQLSSLQPNNAFLLDKTYQLGDGLGGNGGFLLPAVPEPSALALSVLALGGWLIGHLRCRRFKA